MKYLLLISTLFIVACEKGTPDATDQTPDVELSCSSSQASGCITANSAKPVFIGLDENTVVDCGYQMSFYSGVGLTEAFDYSSRTTTSYQTGLLTGLSVHWVNSQAMPVIILPEKTYRVCAFIDFNENGTLDIGEAYSDSNYSTDTKILVISNWSNY